MKKKWSWLAYLSLIFVVVLILNNSVSTGGQIRREKSKSTKSAFVNDVKVANNLQKHGLEILGSNDSLFDSELKNYTGVSETDMPLMLRAAKPFSLILINKSGKDVVGCTLLWTFTFKDGRKEVVPQNEATPGVFMGLKADPTMVGNTSLVSKNKMKLFSYHQAFEQIASNLNMRSEVTNPTRSSGVAELASVILRLEEDRDRLVGAISDVEVSVDGIFFGDGGFVGDDTFHFFEMMKGEIAAKCDLANRLSDAKAGRTDTAFILEDHVAQNSLRPRPSNERSEQRNGSDAYNQGYKSTAYNLAREISRRKLQVSYNEIASEYLRECDGISVVPHKLK